ncbi:ribose ABC transporter membrane protein [Luteibacter rhizovicinus]|uniref:Ribose ABC transporter membrane protein n=1 Tax=Luteibacter rhizovicinus TaxID=242606 RepID=A0A4R3YL34_9GAMM|nr:ribose ABC transporter permease [Luteibacter rhizovicinus]TCV92862.1 ribose ABC transporter membrane protein [Luteibacter rhizovicinus]
MTTRFSWNGSLALIQRLGSVIGLMLLFIVLSIMSPEFLTTGNLLTVLRQVSINALIAFGMTFVILAGGIDLSVGAILALSGAVTAGLMAAGHGVVLAVVAGLGLGALLGVINGALVSWGRVAPFIATLGTMTLIRGLTLSYTEGRPIPVTNNGFALLGGGYVGQLIPIPVVLMFVVFAVCGFLLRGTVFGRHVVAIGGNEEASRLSGVRISPMKLAIYGLSGLLSAFAGVVLTSRLYSAQATAGVGYELDAIAAVVLGGTSLSGGRGWLFGTLIGALLIGFLNNGLNLLGVSSFYQQVVKGIVILIAVLLDRR